jgi:hypothetical protein
MQTIFPENVDPVERQCMVGGGRRYRKGRRGINKGGKRK